MKLTITSFILWIAVITLGMVSENCSAEDIWQGTTNRNVELRESPRLDSRVVESISSGRRIVIEKTEENWLHIITPTGKRAWLRSEEVTIDPEPVSTGTPDPRVDQFVKGQKYSRDESTGMMVGHDYIRELLDRTDRLEKRVEELEKELKCRKEGKDNNSRDSRAKP